MNCVVEKKIIITFNQCESAQLSDLIHKALKKKHVLEIDEETTRLLTSLEMELECFINS